METRGSKDKRISQTKRDLPLVGKSSVPHIKLDRLSRERLLYLRLLFFLIVGILLADVVAMILIYVLPPLPYQYITLIDVGTMMILIFPVLYFLSFRPLMHHMEQRRHVEQVLREKEELQERFFNSIDVLIAYMDRDFNFIRVNDAYARADGCKPDDFLGRNHFALYPHPENQRIFQQVIETGEPFSVYAKPFEYPEHPERGVMYWDWSLQPVKGSSAVVEGLVLSLMDVTEHVHARQELEARANEWRETFDAISEFVSVHDPDFKIIRANRALADHLGKTPQELVGKYCYELFHRSESPFSQCPHAMAISSKRAMTQEVKDSKLGCPLLISVSPILDTNGKLIGSVHIARDITERIQAEEKIRSLASKLAIAEQEERRRISQILHDDSQQSIFAIKTQISMLKTGNETNQLSPDMQANLDQIQNWLSDTIRITRSLSVDLSPIILEGEGLAEAILWLAAQMNEQYGLEVKLQVKEDLHFSDVLTRVLLFQAMRELLFNVVKHAGTLQAEIILEQIDGHGRITIGDAGKGFDVEAVMNEPTVVHGLLVVQKRLNLLGYHMELISAPLTGTRVIIEIPG